MARVLAATTHTISVESGARISVDVAGQGPPLVLLHGFTGSSHSWGAFGDILARGHTLVAVDVIGHGRSRPYSDDDVGPYRMERVAADVVEAVARLYYTKPHWLGYSMGGRLALAVAVLHPESVERLVLIGGSAGLATEAERAARIASDNALAERIEREGIPAFVDAWEALPLFASQQRLAPELRAAIHRGRLRNSATGLANSLRGMGTGAQPSFHDRLATVQAETLVLAGEEDEKFTRIGHDLVAALPRGRFRAIPLAGHAAHTENPEACAAEVAAFLAAAPSLAPGADHARD